jgi:disulfide bond formation protein DsbB
MSFQNVASAEHVRADPGPARRHLIMVSTGVVLLAAATILGALAFEHLGGYLPCPLCLMQRTPYYIGVPLAAVATAAVCMRAPRALITLLFAAFAALMIYGAGLAAYHSGVEWGFWEGPAACAAAGSEPASVTEMMAQLSTTHAPSCTEATWRFLGLSFAGWNTLVSLLLAALGIYGARLAWCRLDGARRNPGSPAAN